MSFFAQFITFYQDRTGRIIYIIPVTPILSP